MAKDYAHIINALDSSPMWAILPEKLEAICEVINIRVAGGFVDPEKVQEVAAVAAARASRTSVSGSGGNIAVIPFYGTVSQRRQAFGSGGVSCQEFGKQFDAIVNDSQVSTIIIDVDSPGGNVYGVQELSQKIFDARGKKRIVAVANSMAASAAYWIATAAHDLYVTPSGDVGSVGVLAVHVDKSGENEKAGRRTTVIRAGQYKAEANPFEPLSEEALEHFQMRADEMYSVFVDALARNRGVSAEQVREKFGKGRLVSAKAAHSAGMVDGVMTLEEVIENEKAGVTKRQRVAAAKAKWN